MGGNLTLDVISPTNKSQILSNVHHVRSLPERSIEPGTIHLSTSIPFSVPGKHLLVQSQQKKY